MGFDGAHWRKGGILFAWCTSTGRGLVDRGVAFCLIPSFHKKTDIWDHLGLQPKVKPSLSLPPCDKFYRWIFAISNRTIRLGNADWRLRAAKNDKDLLRAKASAEASSCAHFSPRACIGTPSPSQSHFRDKCSVSDTYIL